MAFAAKVQFCKDEYCKQYIKEKLRSLGFFYAKVLAQPIVNVMCWLYLTLAHAKKGLGPNWAIIEAKWF